MHINTSAEIRNAVHSIQKRSQNALAQQPTWAATKQERFSGAPASANFSRTFVGFSVPASINLLADKVLITAWLYF